MGLWDTQEGGAIQKGFSPCKLREASEIKVSQNQYNKPQSELIKSYVGKMSRLPQ